MNSMEAIAAVSIVLVMVAMYAAAYFDSLASASEELEFSSGIAKAEMNAMKAKRTAEDVGVGKWCIGRIAGKAGRLVFARGCA